MAGIAASAKLIFCLLILPFAVIATVALHLGAGILLALLDLARGVRSLQAMRRLVWRRPAPIAHIEPE